MKPARFAVRAFVLLKCSHRCLEGRASVVRSRDVTLLLIRFEIQEPQ